MSQFEGFVCGAVYRNGRQQDECELDLGHEGPHHCSCEFEWEDED